MSVNFDIVTEYIRFEIFVDLQSFLYRILESGEFSALGRWQQLVEEEPSTRLNSSVLTRFTDTADGDEPESHRKKGNLRDGFCLHYRFQRVPSLVRSVSTSHGG